MKLGITGSGGFVGSRFIQYNKDKYAFVQIPLRTIRPAELDLSQVDAIVHLAGKAHEMNSIDDRIYYDVNVELTKRLADEAKKQGVRMFVYISSVKVYGEEIGLELDEDSPCEPLDAYGKSKLLAENYLRSIQSDAFRIAIVRPPLVYGPGVKGNMLRFLKLGAKNIPLPFGGKPNQRSMVFLDNLVELINRILDRSASGVFVAGDLYPISTGELMTLIRTFMKKKKRMINVPTLGRAVLKAVSPRLFNRLFGSFVVQSHKTNTALDFHPPYSAEYGIKQMVTWYLQLK